MEIKLQFMENGTIHTWKTSKTLHCALINLPYGHYIFAPSKNEIKSK